MKRKCTIILICTGIVLPGGLVFFAQALLWAGGQKLAQDYLTVQVRNRNVAPHLREEWEDRTLLVPSEEIPDFAPDAFVWLACLNRYQQGFMFKGPAIGFVIGEGKLILTAAHCVSQFQDPTQQASAQQIVAISPHYGDIFDLRIRAIDRLTDLAVLEASWPSHPALEPAGEKELQEAGQLLVTGYPAQRTSDHPLHLAREVRMEKLPVLSIDQSQGNMAIVLDGTRFVRPGWSGSALVLPGTGQVAGVLGLLNIETGTYVPKVLGIPVGSKRRVITHRQAKGAGIRSVRKLINHLGLTEQLNSPTVKLPPVAYAKEAFSLILDYVDSLRNKDYNIGLDALEELVRLRDGSVNAHLWLAFAAADAHNTRIPSEDNLLEVSESNFKKSLELGPDNALVHAGYGNFLMLQKRYDQALPHTLAAVTADPNNELALINQIRILSQSDAERAERIGQSLVERDPNNAHFWYWYRLALTCTKHYDQALEAAQKAVDLNPDGQYEGGLADILTRLNRLQDAQDCYVKMTSTCGCQACWVRYAEFLVTYFPEKRLEAERALARAEAQNQKTVSRNTIDNLKTNMNLATLRLTEQDQPEKTEALARELLKKDPKNGHYWHILAGVLRTQGKYKDAVDAAWQSVQLCPDFPYRPRLADVLAKAGLPSQAEMIYKKMLDDYPERAKYWYWYARFLNEYRPERLPDIQEALSKSQSSTDLWSVSPEKIRELQEKIETSAPQELTNP